MQALIFNSGLGSRLGELTKDRPKCLVRLPSGETILHRQLRMLFACGITEFIITTGPHAPMVKEETYDFEGLGCSIRFVHNASYESTNYIYSMWLAKDELLGRDTLMLHGDLVFDRRFVEKVIADPRPNLGAINSSLTLPEKDFCARLSNGAIREVRVGMREDDGDVVAFQAFYKLSPQALDTWIASIAHYVDRGETNVYAENAANDVFDTMRVETISYEGHVLDEIDTPEDYDRVSQAIAEYEWEAQPVWLSAEDGRLVRLESGGDRISRGVSNTVGELVRALGMQRPLVVADRYFAKRLNAVFGGAFSEYNIFNGVTPNPTDGQVRAAIEVFRQGSCDGVVSIGGGSVIDVAKCVRLWALADRSTAQFEASDSQVGFTETAHLSIPTTAGTGAESTHFAVVYENGNKQSVSHVCAQPDAVVLAPHLLAGLSSYQRAATMMDALCQAIESMWSKRASDASTAHSERAIRIIVSEGLRYLDGDRGVESDMAIAANEAGRAINLTTTTAPHAMSYDVTSRYEMAHGHAVALCMIPVWEHLLACAEGSLKNCLERIDSVVAGSDTSYGAGLEVFKAIMAHSGLRKPEDVGPSDIAELVANVNQERLSNHPIRMDEKTLSTVYSRALM